MGWGVNRVLIEGPIENGDAATFRALDDDLQRHGRLWVVELDSPGGNVGAAAEIADVVHRDGLGTVVWKGYVCASACVMIFFAGKTRTLDDGGVLGVHRAVGPDGLETPASRKASLLIADKLASYGVSRTTTDKLLVTAPSEMIWLDGKDGDASDHDFIQSWCEEPGIHNGQPECRRNFP
jgi:hypothetical protein